MKLSIVIVNYNVKFFLNQCLKSVEQACQNIESEVFVVDNNSTDKSVEMIEDEFPDVKLIANKKNKGFSFANNQAIKVSSGEYVLLLNPDTIVNTNTFTSIIKFMDETPDAGGLGVKMVDGQGDFLPESKRGFPSPTVAFYKMFGLTLFFPKSKIFGKYHLGYLDEDKISEVDVLSGAFMLLRKATLEKTGLLDESYFMYGEDVDLSYRIIKAGYKNYYFPETQIIHYKGESTKRTNINYIIVFYRAMIIFARTHLSKGNAKLFSFLLNMAIYVRASIALIVGAVRKFLGPISDSIAILSTTSIGFQLMKQLSFFNPDSNPLLIYSGSMYYWSALALIITMIALFRGYTVAPKRTPILLAVLLAWVFIGSGLTYQFGGSPSLLASLIIFSGLSYLSVYLSRVTLNLFNFEEYYKTKKNRRIAVVGEKDEVVRVRGLLQSKISLKNFIGFISPQQTITDLRTEYIGKIDQLRDVVEIYDLNEIIFCSQDLNAQKIIDQMSNLEDSNVLYKIAPPNSSYIIGSKSIMSFDK